jgi:hypothetical protein
MEEEKKKIMYTYELLGKKINKEEINKLVMNQFLPILEKEIEKIKRRKLKENIKDYGLMLEQIEVIAYATLNRAYKGEERGSIRRHSQLFELYGMRPQDMKKQGGLFSSWISK